MPRRWRSCARAVGPSERPSTSTSPASWRVEPLQDLDRRGLAGAVRTEQPEALAGADLEVEAVDGRDVAVALDEPGAAERDPPGGTSAAVTIMNVKVPAGCHARGRRAAGWRQRCVWRSEHGRSDPANQRRDDGVFADDGVVAIGTGGDDRCGNAADLLETRERSRAPRRAGRRSAGRRRSARSIPA